MSRPQVGIDRLQVKKPMNEPKEAMNCKSCRKRKIKCNRVKPSCEACTVFNCACVYDAIPKKRGPKTDVLESLLKRVNGLEKRLKEEQKSSSTEALDSDPQAERNPGPNDSQDVAARDTSQTPPPRKQEIFGHRRSQTLPSPSGPTSATYEAVALTDALLDTYFARVHNRPYYILDETATRQRLRDGRLPSFLINAIHAVTVRYVPHICGGPSGVVRSSDDYVTRARAQIDVDEPSIDTLQALLLLAMANFQNGRGKRCYMVLTHAVSTAFALNLHFELPTELRIANSERESRRKLFWTCYLMDRFTVSGSKRPSLISDDSIHLRLPGWQQAGSQQWMEGNYFPNGSSLPYISGVTSAAQSSGTMLVEIVRVLGVTNRYLCSGGVKGDSHFPWHAQSTLSRIRSDLDYWAAATQDVFTSIDTLFGSHDSPTLVLSKLIYHLIHCLIYRPFLPIDLAELSGTGQNQSWQIEATNLCFLHANAIAELVEIGKNTTLLDWPSFVGYCICTAGTVHVHGAHYRAYREGDAFCHSAEFLAREMAQLLELQSVWTAMQHQRDTLRMVYASHGQLVASLASSPMRFSPVFQMEDFFDRYPGSYIDGAHVTFADIILDTPLGPMPSPDAWSGPAEQNTASFCPETDIPYTPSLPWRRSAQNRCSTAKRKSHKRRYTTSSQPYPTPPHLQAVSHAIAEEEQSVDENRSNTEATEAAQSLAEAQFENNDQNPTLYPGGAFTPNFGFSPNTSALTLHDAPQSQHDHNHDMPNYGSSHGDPASDEVEHDPFLGLLEQLAQNDTLGPGDHGELDFFLSGNI